ncbi:MAG: pyridoxal phosphate-dependent decarboxylase family protein, partial [Candidatus Hodarchaeota archaeon]
TDKEVEKEEETLDPADWNHMKDLGCRMVVDIMNYLESVRERPVWQPIPNSVKEFFTKPMPTDPEGVDKIYYDFLENILPYPTGNIHPRFWGWVIGTGTPLGMLAEMLAAGMNPHVGGGEDITNHVEVQVINWFKEIMGFPSTASGLLVSGGSMANLVGLTVARNVMAGYDIRKEGVKATKKMTFYSSEETHLSNPKAIEILGLGRDAFHKIPVNEEFQIQIEILKECISKDRDNGYQPACIIGNAGTINTGAFDDLDMLANICDQENMWFHIDGAFGALAILSPKLRSLVTGMSRADSLAFDLHKWMYMPLEVGCVLVRSEEDHKNTFQCTVSSDYLTHHSRGIASGEIWFMDYGVQMSRGFRALKVWMGIKEQGIKKYGRLIRQNVEQAQYLEKLIQLSTELEILAPVSLNIVCFRFVTDRLDNSSLNNLNKEILMRLHENGIAAPSYTMIDDKYSLRVAITNHRSRREDFDVLIKAVLEIGRELLKNQ